MSIDVFMNWEIWEIMDWNANHPEWICLENFKKSELKIFKCKTHMYERILKKISVDSKY